MSPPAALWHRGRTIGRGSTATVSLATVADTGDLFAVKSAQLASPAAAALRREQQLLSALSSPHVVAYAGFDVAADHGGESDCLSFNLFMEYAPAGSLADEVKRQGGRLDGCSLRRFTRDLVAGLAYIHGAGIVHCDVKTQNVLVAADGRAKIADFGCAKRSGAGDDCAAGGRLLRGTPMFMAPEVARGEEQCTAADVWALGCTVIEMATGSAPWPEFRDPMAALHHIGFSDDVPSTPAELPEEGRDFLDKCLRRSPEKRWTAEQLLRHPFVAGAGEMDRASCGYSGDGNLWGESPKSVLDQGLWETATTAETEEPLGTSARLGELVGAAPDWAWGEEWLTVRGGHESGAAGVAEAGTSGGEGGDLEEGALVGLDRAAGEEGQLRNCSSGKRKQRCWNCNLEEDESGGGGIGIGIAIAGNRNRVKSGNWNENEIKCGYYLPFVFVFV